MKATLDLLGTKGLVHDREGWERRWERVWQMNLDSCDDKGICNMVLS